MIEQVIANFKTSKGVHTDYRRPLGTFDTTISAVAGLHFYRMASISLLEPGEVVMDLTITAARSCPTDCAPNRHPLFRCADRRSTST